MVLYSAKLKSSAKPIEKPDLSNEVVDKKEAAKLARKEKARLKKEAMLKQEEEAKAELEAKEKELKDAEEALIAKKEAQKEKRRLARQAKKQTPTPPESVTTEPVEEVKPKKRKRKQVTIDDQVDEIVKDLEDKEEPPAWFRKYVAGVKNEERELQEPPKKPKKEVAKEADEMAQQQWGNGLVRDRVRNEVDKHMSRMYQMIFNRSSFDGL